MKAPWLTVTGKGAQGACEIRTNSRSHRSLGLEYGVSKTTIGRIKRGTMWQPKGSALREWPS